MFVYILYASRVPTSPERVEANPRPVVPKLPKMVPRGVPKLPKMVPWGVPGEVPGEPGGAENPKFERRRYEEQITLL